MIRVAKKILLAKVETTYGTDAAPSGAANAILARNLTLTPLEGTELPRDNIRASFGSPDNAPMAGLNAKLEFDIEAAGSGAAGAAPAWGVLMRGCGFAETITAGAKVDYTPVTGGEESVTIHFFRDGVQHKITGSRGDWSFKIGTNGEALMHFAMTGLYVDIIDAAIPAATLSGFKAPVPADNTHTPTFTLMGYAAALKSLDIQRGNDVQYRDLVNAQRVDIVNRKMAGTAVFEEPLIAQHDFYADSKNAAMGALSLVHGTVAGNIIELASTRTQIGKVTLSEDQGVSFMNAPLILSPTNSPGDDELTVTAR